MKSFRSYKKYHHKYGIVKVTPFTGKAFLGVAIILLFTAVTLELTTPRLYDATRTGYASSLLTRIHGLDWKSFPLLSRLTTHPAPSPMDNSFSHNNITSTVFWAGEGADASNGYIANEASAWDEQWAAHYGGLDNPSKRSGYYPAGFTPKENPFYVALPYNDISASSARKKSAINCLTYAANKEKNYSWCKNIWVKIRHNQKIVYAQWEDVGPFEEDDVNYVFGRTMPKNKFGAHAGIDVSPAVRDYLGLNDVDKVDWSFVLAEDVRAGPWRQVVSSSLGSSLN